jgi:hypothetical protein
MALKVFTLDAEEKIFLEDDGSKSSWRRLIFRATKTVGPTVAITLFTYA